MRKRISIIGSTGSIGTQALEVIEALGADKFEIYGLAAGSNTGLLNEQIKKFSPKKVCITKNSDDVNFNKVLTGEEGLIDIASDKENDIVLMAISGRYGLKPTLAAIHNGIDIALANKETLVMAGDIVMREAKKYNVNIIQTTPSRFNILLEEDSSFLENISDLLVGGEALPKNLLLELNKFPNLKIFNMYGPTETTVWSTIKENPSPDNITIGKPIANTQVYILDDNYNLLPPYLDYLLLLIIISLLLQYHLFLLLLYLLFLFLHH